MWQQIIYSIPLTEPFPVFLQRLPDASITADVIVGFPGETEEDFQDTLSLMEEVKFDTVNTAAYSPRPNTPAATWENQLDDTTKQDRLQRINVLVKQHAAERRARMMGRTVEVLVEERNVRVPTQVMGRTTHGYIVYFEGDIDELRGELVNVEIEQTKQFHLVGKIVPWKFQCVNQKSIIFCLHETKLCATSL